MDTSQNSFGTKASTYCHSQKSIFGNSGQKRTQNSLPRIIEMCWHHLKLESDLTSEMVPLKLTVRFISVKIL